MTRNDTVLITGATGGIGIAIARALARAGGQDRAPRLLLGGRDSHRLNALCADTGGEPWLVDQSDPADLEQALTRLPPVTAVVHCAGSYARGLIPDLPAVTWRESFQLNVLSAVSITQAVLPSVRAATGHVVFLNSGAGLFAYRTGAIYSSTKFALRAFADTLRVEEEDFGVRVTSIHPGRTDTGMLRKTVEEFENDEYTEQGYLRPAEVADLVVLALSTRPGVAMEDIRMRPVGRNRLLD